MIIIHKKGGNRVSILILLTVLFLISIAFVEAQETVTFDCNFPKEVAVEVPVEVSCNIPTDPTCTRTIRGAACVPIEDLTTEQRSQLEAKGFTFKTVDSLIEECIAKLPIFLQSDIPSNRGVPPEIATAFNTGWREVIMDDITFYLFVGEDGTLTLQESLDFQPPKYVFEKSWTNLREGLIQHCLTLDLVGGISWLVNQFEIKEPLPPPTFPAWTDFLAKSMDHKLLSQIAQLTEDRASTVQLLKKQGVTPPGAVADVTRTNVVAYASVATSFNYLASTAVQLGFKTVTRTPPRASVFSFLAKVDTIETEVFSRCGAGTSSACSENLRCVQNEESRDFECLNYNPLGAVCNIGDCANGLSCFLNPNPNGVDTCEDEASIAAYVSWLQDRESECPGGFGCPCGDSQPDPDKKYCVLPLGCYNVGDQNKCCSVADARVGRC